jgi:hypothetical protein
MQKYLWDKKISLAYRGIFVFFLTSNAQLSYWNALEVKRALVEGYFCHFNLGFFIVK